MEQRSRAMSPGEAQRVTRHLAPSVMSGWSDLAEDQKTERFSEWSRRLEAQCRSLGDDLCRETKKMSFKIQKDTAQEFHSDEPPIGIITPAETNGEFHPEIARTINREEFEAAQAQGQIWQYHAITGNLIPLRESWNQNDPKRLFLAPGGASPSPPASVAAASRLGALEIHLSQNERLRLRNAGFSASEAWRRQSHRHDAYLDTPDSYAVLSGVAGSSQTWRVVLESEALELVEKQELSLKRSSTGETIDPAAFKSQEFWNHDMLEIYLNGDYRFENYSGERIWTYEELWREGRLAVFEEIPGGGSWNRVHASVLENPSWGERALKILAYFGSTPEIVGSATLDQLMLETSFVREIILTQRGAERLKNQAEENLGQARQAAYVYLKTVHGFSRDGQGRVTEIYLTAKEMEKAKKRHSKSELYLSGKMVLFLTTNGQITEVLMNAMDGKQTRLALQGDTAGAGQWGSEWAAIELGSDYRVLRIYQASDLKDGVPNEWAYYMDDRKIYHINDNIFPGGADAGRARALATVNTANGSLVLAPSTTLNEGTRKAQRHINRVIAHNVIGTLALAGEIGVEAVFAPWTLPFGAGVGGANVAERVSTRAGEGSMEKSWGFWFDALREVGDFVLFKRVIPQPKDRLNDPSGNPVQITEKPATFWDRALYWATFTLCGRIDERRVEVDPETHEKTYHYVRPGLKALRRSQGYHIEEEESRREQALAQFNGGLALQESKTSRGVYGDYRESHVQVIPKGESYARALTSLRSLGVRLTPDGAFYLDVVPMEAEVSGQVIPGITGAEQNFAARAESTQDHSAETAMIQGAGGTLIAFYENGVVKERSPSVGESALKHWQRQIEMTMQMSEGVLYDSQTQIYVDSRGRWLFNPATLTLVSFDERGQVKQTYQAVPSAGAREEKAQKEAVLSSYYTNYSVILEQGAVIHLNAQGEIMAYETGVAAVNAYLADHSNLLLTDESMETQGQILFEKSDGAGDLVINPAAALISAP
ncbi:MAG: hypothetical protein HY547_03405 [Elusimicrobia bacterium]|nr:hypothetical protein [Elusimicrobiota bacterium]